MRCPSALDEEDGQCTVEEGEHDDIDGHHDGGAVALSEAARPFGCVRLRSPGAGRPFGGLLGFAAPRFPLARLLALLGHGIRLDHESDP